MPIACEGIAQTLEVLDDPCVIHLVGVVRDSVIDSVNSRPLVFMAGKQLGDAHCAVRLPVHEEFDYLGAKRPDPRPFADGVGLLQTTEAEYIKRLARPTQHGDRFYDGQRRRVVRPCAAIGQADRMLRDVVVEVRRRCGSRQRGIDCQGFVVVAKTRAVL